MELGPVEILIPAIVTALIAIARQTTEKLDGPAAYWVSIGLNIVAQVAAALATGGEPVGAAALGLGTGAIVGPGLATTGKRLGMGKAIKPRSDSA